MVLESNPQLNSLYRCGAISSESGSESHLEFGSTDNDLKVVPRHLGIIMDGNRRWAKKHRLPSIFGHRRGAGRVLELIPLCKELGIETVTLFAFSTENWRRKPFEVKALFHLFKQQLRTMRVTMVQEGVRLRVIGSRCELPVDLLELIEAVEAETAHCSAINCVIALNYGGRNEIVRAMDRWLSQYDTMGAKGVESMREELTEERLEACLDTAGLGAVDMIIRTSGCHRLSNFLLWQSAYAEMICVKTLWPDFSRDHLMEAVNEYRSRSRTYGGTLQWSR